MENIDVNEVEYAYLKLISLFNSGKCWCKNNLFQKWAVFIMFYEYLIIDNPSERQQLYKLQEKAIKEMKQYLIKECNDDHRVAVLLLRLPTLRSLQPSVIEEIFFSSLLGSFQIDAIIPQILKLKGSSTGIHIFLIILLFFINFLYAH